MGNLFIVATPIGNLGDITLRALETLQMVDCIACEDTRRTLKLLNHFTIKKPLISCRAQNEVQAAEKIITLLSEGKSVAFTSDAGTPAISDPGARLVRIVREAGYTIIPIPGVSALATLMSVAGSTAKTLIFEGFLSPKSGRRKKRLQELFDMGGAIILYESPFRIFKLLKDIADIDSERKIIIGRELTKLHEEIIIGKVGILLEDFANLGSTKGEFTVFIDI